MRRHVSEIAVFTGLLRKIRDIACIVVRIR